MINLVTLVLEPTIGNYFRNAAQGSDVIDFLKQRQKRQEEAKASIGAALTEYNVGAVDTLIGDIVPPAELMKTLTDRKIAEQEQVTYTTQKQAEEARKDLQQAKAIADTQPRVVDAERSVAIAKFNAEAAVENANGAAKAKTVNAEADAKVITLVGAAEGGKITAVGTAEADVIQKKTNAIGQGNYAMIGSVRAISAAGIPLVPQIFAGGAGSGGEGNQLVNMIMANMLASQVEKKTAHPQAPAST
jgi:uncharacterized membrane protein YqiK